MSPLLSTARLGMKRFIASGAQVDCWRTAPIDPPVTGSSYQRTCATLPPLPTVCVSQSDSRPPMFVYWFCIISRYESVSSWLPSFSGTVEGPTLNVETPVSVGPVNVEFAGVVQSTWNFHVRIAYEPQIDAK